MRSEYCIRIIYVSQKMHTHYREIALESFIGSFSMASAMYPLARYKNAIQGNVAQLSDIVG
jgi:hypothetical protein